MNHIRSLVEVLGFFRRIDIASQIEKLENLLTWSSCSFVRKDRVAVVVDYPTPSEGWSPRSQETPQGLDQRS